MLKTLLKPKILFAMVVALTAQAAIADQSACNFFPKNMGPIEDYEEPTRVEDAVANELIGKLTQSEVVAEKPVSLVQYNIELASDGHGNWTISQLPPKRGNMVFASVRGTSPSRIGERWRQDYYRALTKVLSESMRRGRNLDILALGKCE